MTPPDTGGPSAFVRDGDQWVRLDVQDILYVEADDDQAHIATAQRRFTVNRTLKQVLEGLPQESLQRVHRSFAVNLRNVTAYSEGHLHLGGRQLPVGRSFKRDLVQRLNLL